MTQPPVPPHGGDEAGNDRSGYPGWSQPGADDPTRKLSAPDAEGQRNATQQFGQPQGSQYGPPPHGQQSGQVPYPEYGQPQYGPPQSGQPQYGPPQYQPQYGQPQYGPPQYGPPQYGQQPWGPAGGPGGPRPKKKRNTALLLVLGAVLFLAVIAAGVFFLLRASDPGSGAASPTGPLPTGSGGIPSATMAPDGLGDDPELDGLAQSCYDGDMQACDDLYQVAELDSLYGLYGGTCAGRQDISNADTIFCTDAFPED